MKEEESKIMQEDKQ
ncbi:hypothetical protein S40285_10935 [Stachybotrys chlorohalonatus IBT 40285]|uniref:Uncharacterized protein n=1 Tax=Stachybotrys chlorohalonatus (strain IBT 40285) TaxID=1283841 RepID=A0A084QLM8_STAC4|nr:hypothetical protein S40285_10935 [Stachybotrys chlorohalonata IBT 40285]